MGQWNTMSGTSGEVFCGSCTIHPVGARSDIPSLLLAYGTNSGSVSVGWIVGVNDKIRSSSFRSNKSEISDLCTTLAVKILACSGSVGTSLALVYKDAILSRVSKLSCVTILPNTVYCSSKKFESPWTIKNCELAL